MQPRKKLHTGDVQQNQNAHALYSYKNVGTILKW